MCMRENNHSRYSLYKHKNILTLKIAHITLNACARSRNRSNYPYDQFTPSCKKSNVIGITRNTSSENFLLWRDAAYQINYRSRITRTFSMTARTSRGARFRFHCENTRMVSDNQRALRAVYEAIFFVCRGNSMIKTYSYIEGRETLGVLLQGYNSFNTERQTRGFDWRFRLPRARARSLDVRVENENFVRASRVSWY